RIPQGVRETIDHRQIDTILAHAWRRQTDVSDDRFLTAERPQAEAVPDGTHTDFLRVESNQMKSCESACGRADDCCLADAGPSREEQRHSKHSGISRFHLARAPMREPR